MISARFILLVAFCCSVAGLSASPRSDLSSTNQETREAAAKILRATYIPPPRTNWDSLIASLKPGSPKTNIISSLQRVIVRPEGGGGSGTFEAHQFRLDDVWILECYFNSDIFSGSKLFSNVLDVWVDPPPNFTGLWTTFQVNGQTSYELHYKGGQRDGAVTSFYDDGSRAVLTHFVAGMQEGDETGYYPSGKESYRGAWKANARVGTWIHYNEDGTVQSKQDRSKP